MMGWRSKLLWGALTVLMGLALWMSRLGQVYLYAVPDGVLESLASGKGLVSEKLPWTLTTLLAHLPGDALRNVSLFCLAILLCSFIALWLSLHKIWQNFISASLTTGALFFGANTLWLTSDTPTACLGAAFKALGVACLVAGKVPLLLGPVLGAAYCDPAAGVALYLALAYMAYKRHEAYGVPVAVSSVLGGGLLLAMFCADYTLRPSVSGMGVWALLPLLALLGNKELRASRSGLYLTLLLGSAVTGSAEVASAICLGDIALLALKVPASSNPAPRAPGEWRIPLRMVIHAAALVALIMAVLPGEQYLNRQILIPAQEKKVAFQHLMVPFSLHKHAELLESEPWRLQTPYPGIRAQDVNLLREVKTPFRVLTLGQVAEDRQLSLVYALLSGQKLAGWDSTHELSASSLVCKQLGRNVVVGQESMLLRADDSSRLEPGIQLPGEVKDLPPVDFRRLLNVPFRAQIVSEGPGTGFRLAADEGVETLFFADTPAQVAFSTHPHRYLLASLSNDKNRRELEIASPSLALTAVEPNNVIPSRSLVPLEFKLTNTGLSPLSTDELESVTLRMQAKQPISPAQQAFTKKFILWPEETIKIQLFLATPEAEGRYQLAASFKTIDGRSRELPVNGDDVVNSWRRLPPVGTWIEEPPTP